jgi:prevent-host-death family protein
MRKISLLAAKQKLSELVERAAHGERIGIIKRGKLAAMIGPVPGRKVDLSHVFDEIEKIRRRAKKIPGVTAKSLVEEGRM